jgi:hypothetical protein
LTSALLVVVQTISKVMLKLLKNKAF